MIEVYEYNHATGKKLERAFTADELTQIEKDKRVQVEADALATERATAKAALLERLGITADEAALLLS